MFHEKIGINEDEGLSPFCNYIEDVSVMLKSYISYFPIKFEYQIDDDELQKMQNYSEERDSVYRVHDIVDTMNKEV